MNVYVVKTLVDTEYGNYDIYGIYDSMKKAEQTVNELGNYKVNVWYNDKGENQYEIEEWKVM